MATKTVKTTRKKVEKKKTAQKVNTPKKVAAKKTAAAKAPAAQKSPVSEKKRCASFGYSREKNDNTGKQYSHTNPKRHTYAF